MWGCPDQCSAFMKTTQNYYFWMATSLGFPVPCQDLDPDKWEGDFHVQIYFQGLAEYLRLSISQRTEFLIKVGPEIFGIAVENHASFLAHVLSDDFVNPTRNWYIMDGYPHPRGLRGCDFWISWEVQAIMVGTDLCAVGQYSSLRSICPVACRCRSGDEQCPLSCSGSASLGAANAGESDGDTQHDDGDTDAGDENAGETDAG